MKAVRLHEINKLICENIDQPLIKGDEILMRVSACGVCGSDIPRVFSLGTKVTPVTLGHEFSGTIYKVANDNDKDLIGKKAAVFNISPCFKCVYCKRGYYAQCEAISYIGTRIDGGFAEYCRIPSRFNVVVCDSELVSAEDLALIEPASVALHVIRKSDIHCGEKLMIIGAGPIGILIARWAQIFGIQDIILVDVSEEKTNFAKSFGLNAINFKNSNCKFDLLKYTNGKGADIVVEGSGTGAGINMAIECARAFGKVILLGNPHMDTIIPITSHSNIMRKELTLIGVWNSYFFDDPVNEWKYSIRMIHSKKLKVNDLITHRVKLEELPKLFENIHHKQVIACKAIYSAEI